MTNLNQIKSNDLKEILGQIEEQKIKMDQLQPSNKYLQTMPLQLYDDDRSQLKSQNGRSVGLSANRRSDKSDTRKSSFKSYNKRTSIGKLMDSPKFEKKEYDPIVPLYKKAKS